MSNDEQDKSTHAALTLDLLQSDYSKTFLWDSWLNFRCLNFSFHSGLYTEITVLVGRSFSQSAVFGSRNKKPVRQKPRT